MKWFAHFIMVHGKEYWDYCLWLIFRNSKVLFTVPC